MAIPVPANHGAQQLGAVTPKVGLTQYSSLRAPDTSSAGQQLAQFGKAMAGMNLQIQQRSDEVNILEAEKELNTILMAYNDPEGYRSQLGVNAAGITDTIQQDWAKRSAEIAKRYKSKLSGKSQRALDQHIETTGMRVHGSTATHELNEMNKAVLAGMDASMNLTADSAAVIQPNEMLLYETQDTAKSGKDSFDPSFAAAVVKTKATVAQMNAKIGAAPETAAALLLDKTSALVNKRVNFMATGSSPNPIAAENFLDLSHAQGLISNENYASLKKVLTPMAEAVVSRANAVTAIQQDAFSEEVGKQIKEAEQSASQKAASIAGYVSSEGAKPHLTGFIPAMQTAYTTFAAQANAAGLSVDITSGFRSATHQASIIGNNMNNYIDPRTGVGFTAEAIAKWRADSAGGNGMAIEAGQRWAAIFDGSTKFQGDGTGQAFRSRIGMPGMSRHQHGVAADISVNGKRVSDLSAEQKQKLVAIAQANGMHFPLGNEDWHLELQGVEGSRANISTGGTVSAQTGHDRLVADLMGAKTDKDRRMAVASLAAYNDINGEINVARTNMQSELSRTAADDIVNSSDAIRTGQLQLEQLVSLEDRQKMGSAQLASITALYEQVKSGAFVTTDMSEDSPYRQAMDLLSSGGDRDQVKAALANLTGSPEYKTGVSPTDDEAIRAAGDAFGSYAVAPVPQIATAVTSVANANEMLAGMKPDEKAAYVAKAVQAMLPKLIALSTATTGEALDMTSAEAQQLIQEALTRVTTDGDDEGVLRATYVSDLLTKHDGDNEAAYQDIRDDLAFLGRAPGSEGVKVETTDVDALWASLKMQGIATIPNLLEAAQDLVEWEDGGSPVLLLGSPLNPFLVGLSLEGTEEREGWGFLEEAVNADAAASVAAASSHDANTMQNIPEFNPYPADHPLGQIEGRDGEEPTALTSMGPAELRQAAQSIAALEDSYQVSKGKGPSAMTSMGPAELRQLAQSIAALEDSYQVSKGKGPEAMTSMGATTLRQLAQSIANASDAKDDNNDRVRIALPKGVSASDLGDIQKWLQNMAKPAKGPTR